MKLYTFCLIPLYCCAVQAMNYTDYVANKNPEPEELAPCQEWIDWNQMEQHFILETKKIEVPGHPFAFNPSIVRFQGKLLMSFRTYKPETRSTNPFGLIWLSNTFEPIGEAQLFELPFHNPVLPSKQQDPRLITVGERLFVLYNNILETVTQREMRRMFIAEIIYNGMEFTALKPECLQHFEGENSLRYEKNWVPFEYQNMLFLGYSITPHRILRPLLGTGICETAFVHQNDIPWKWGVPRGGTQAIRDRDRYIAFLHSWIDVPSMQSNGKKITHYLMGAYTFDAHPPFAIRSISPQPIVTKTFYDPPYYRTWKPLRCVFPAGLIVEDSFLWMTYGRQDHECWVAKIDKQALLDSLVPITNE